MSLTIAYKNLLFIDPTCVGAAYFVEGLQGLKRQLLMLSNNKVSVTPRNPQQISARAYTADIIVSDGNFLLSTAGRAANYLCPASGGVERTLPDAEDLKAVFEYVLYGNFLSEENPTGLLRLEKFRWIHRFTRYLGLRAVWLLDIVIFLDLFPDMGLKRIVSRGRKIYRHENRDGLGQARALYLYRSPGAVHRIEGDHLTPGETLRAVVELLTPPILGWQSRNISREIPLGTITTTRTNRSVWAKILTHRYLIPYLVRNWFRGAWREPTFLAAGGDRAAPLKPWRRSPGSPPISTPTVALPAHRPHAPKGSASALSSCRAISQTETCAEGLKQLRPTT